MDDDQLARIRRALETERTIDIITRGARSGRPRTTEIWFSRIGEAIFICGTPAGEGGVGPRRKRDWLANLKANPEFTLVLKGSITASLPAVAAVVTDASERALVFAAPETSWYREQTRSMTRLIEEAPLVKVTFRGDASTLNT